MIGTDKGAHGFYDKNHSTPQRAETLYHTDKDLSLHDHNPLPPPVPPKDDSQFRLGKNPERVKPWVLRRMKTTVTPTAQMTRSLESVSAGDTGSQEPPSYQVAHKSYPSEEMSWSVSEATSAAKTSRTVTSVPTHSPTKLARPKKPGGARSLQNFVTNLQQSAFEERSRPDAIQSGGTSEPARPPSYHHFEAPPAPSPYHASKGCSALSLHSQPVGRSQMQSSTFEGASSLTLPNHPPLPGSALPRIRAAYKVSKEFGDTVVRQEVRMAMSVVRAQLDSVPTPRITRRFMSATELEGFRKAKERVDERSREHEARERVLSQPSSKATAKDSHQVASISSRLVNHGVKTSTESKSIPAEIAIP
ncbi:hypothetical protein B0F90DRAFT_1815143 [Multifurca ochricompacta]|uniref:Uncharacterized protein n=1 Tax=Multifurca ochricompacta TaxID=376703 RepID=A0AAD4QPE3_9AGAM|nr:hypothetical protein B0F90DRAFT_1815143 [Multifurca ochricompacta]